jgi:hypothetical protein
MIHWASVAGFSIALDHMAIRAGLLHSGRSGQCFRGGALCRVALLTEGAGYYIGSMTFEPELQSSQFMPVIIPPRFVISAK